MAEPGLVLQQTLHREILAASPGGSRKRSRTADPSFSRAASEAPSESGSMDWAGSSQAGEEEDVLPNGNEPTPAPPSFDEHIPSVEVGCQNQPSTLVSVAAYTFHLCMG